MGVAITTAAIVARNHWGRLSARNTAKNVNVWIPPAVTKTKINVVCQSTKAMATVTTKTTTVVAISTAAIVARKHSERMSAKNTAKNASARIRSHNKLCFSQDFF